MIDTTHLHLYVTRNAVLGYQRAMSGKFEATRRMLTEKLLDTPQPDTDHEGCYLLDVWDDVSLEYRTFRVYTIEDSPLLVVTKTELAEPVP